MIETLPHKRPETTYSRKNVVKSNTPVTASKGITEENFAQRVLEVFKPVTPSKSPSSSESDHDDEEEEDLCKRHCVRNVHELLESGLSNRFYDELDYLVSGLESLPPDTKSKTTSARQQYLFDLGHRLFSDTSPMQTSRLRSSGFLERIIKSLTAIDNLDAYSKRFLMTLLYLLCDDIRRVDHFIDVSSGFELAKWLLKQDGQLNDPTTTVRLEKLFQEAYIPYESLADLGLWLLAKLNFSIQTSTEQPWQQLNDFEIIECCCALLRGTCTEHEIRVSRLLFILDSIVSMRSNKESLNLDMIIDSVSKLLDSLLLNDIMLLQPFHGCLRLLISLSGPDDGAMTLCQQPVIMKLPELLRQAINSPDEDFQVLTCTLIANIADRHPTIRSTFDESLEDLSRRCCLESNTSYCFGMLLGIILAEEGSRRLRLFANHTSLCSSIYKSFDTLIEKFSQVGKLDASLQSQLRSFQSVYRTN